jgi:hypothetical protein
LHAGVAFHLGYRTLALYHHCHIVPKWHTVFLLTLLFRRGNMDITNLPAATMVQRRVRERVCWL